MNRLDLASPVASAPGYMEDRSPLLRRDVGRRDAAVHEKFGPRHKRRFLGGQEQRRPRDLLRLAEAPDRDMNQAPLAVPIRGNL
jgi:hypothetical protein